MDTVLLFALPLVGGLIFSNTWNFTRYRAAREEGHRLYFRAVLVGSLLFVLVLSTRILLLHRCPRYRAFDSAITNILEPLAKDPNSASATAELAIVCFCAMLIAWPIALLLNIVFRQKRFLWKAIRGDEFEALLYSALNEKSPLFLSTSEGKVYVGFVVSTFDPTKTRKTFSLLPLVSGYRDKDTHKVTFTTYYTKIYGNADRAHPLAPPLDHLNPEDFVTVFPVDCVASCHRFDFDAYEAFNRAPAPEAGAAADESDLDLRGG